MTTSLALALSLAAAPSPPADDPSGADLAMSRAVEARDAAAFATFLDPDAIFAGERGLSDGREVVLAAWAPYLTAGGPALAWRPDRTVVSSSGDLAVTTGRYTWTGTVEGKTARAEGEYVTVWRRGADGRWRVLFDASLEPAAALGTGLERSALRTLSSTAGDLEATLGSWKRGAATGAYLLVRRGPEAARDTVVDSAFPFRPPARSDR